MHLAWFRDFQVGKCTQELLRFLTEKPATSQGVSREFFDLGVEQGAFGQGRYYSYNSDMRKWMYIYRLYTEENFGSHRTSIEKGPSNRS